MESKKGRMRYSCMDDIYIIKYLLDDERHKLVGGNQVWRDMEVIKITNHSADSMKDRYRRYILPNIESYNIDDSGKTKLKLWSQAKFEESRKHTTPSFENASTVRSLRTRGRTSPRKLRGDENEVVVDTPTTSPNVRRRSPRKDHQSERSKNGRGLQSHVSDEDTDSSSDSEFFIFPGTNVRSSSPNKKLEERIDITEMDDYDNMLLEVATKNKQNMATQNQTATQNKVTTQNNHNTATGNSISSRLRSKADVVMKDGPTVQTPVIDDGAQIPDIVPCSVSLSRYKGKRQNIDKNLSNKRQKSKISSKSSDVGEINTDLENNPENEKSLPTSIYNDADNYRERENCLTVLKEISKAYSLEVEQVFDILWRCNGVVQDAIHWIKYEKLTDGSMIWTKEDDDHLMQGDFLDELRDKYGSSGYQKRRDFFNSISS